MRRSPACRFLVLALFMAHPLGLRAQAPGIAGSWHGTSTCVDQVAFPRCQHEEVIYDVTPHARAGDTVQVRADKVVGGVREFMGEFAFARQPDGSWATEFRNERVHIRIVLVTQGDQMTGQLLDLPRQLVVRRMELRRAG